MGGNIMDRKTIAKLFSYDHLDQGKSTVELLKMLHDNKAECPHCKNPLEEHKHKRFFENKMVNCSACGKIFSGVSKTILSKRNPAKIFLYCFLRDNGFSRTEIAEIAGVSYPTVKHLDDLFDFLEIKKEKER